MLGFDQLAVLFPDTSVNKGPVISQFFSISECRHILKTPSLFQGSSYRWKPNLLSIETEFQLESGHPLLSNFTITGVNALFPLFLQMRLKNTCNGKSSLHES